MSAEEAILDGIEKSLDEMEPILEAAEKAVAQITKQDLLITAVVAGGIAGTAAYFITKRVLKTKYEAIAEQEIADAKEFYSAMHKRGGYSTPEEAAKTIGSTSPATEEAVKALLNYGRTSDDDEDEGEEEDVDETNDVNVFLEHTPVDDDWDIEEEMKTRTPENPYIISQEEFLTAEPEFQQTTITYYAGDGTLADERDQEIPFADPIVGEENLYHFGRGSGDDRIVYIRNERLSRDFEVLKSDGKYAHEVLGLEHSDGGSRGRQQSNRHRKFRGDDV